jgi:hypothetical protein
MPTTIHLRRRGFDEHAAFAAQIAMRPVPCRADGHPPRPPWRRRNASGAPKDALVVERKSSSAHEIGTAAARPAQSEDCVVEV